jgi:hypothetical protein
MTMADVLTGTLIVLGLLVTLPALWLLMRALFPAAVGRSRDRIAAAPVRCFFLGLLPGLFLFVGSVALLNLGGPPGKLLGLLMFTAGVLLAGVGLAGFSAVVGERLPSTADEGRPWRGMVRGAVCLELSFLLPVIGWFGVLPIAMLTGLGAAVMALAVPGDPRPLAAAGTAPPAPTAA